MLPLKLVLGGECFFASSKDPVAFIAVPGSQGCGDNIIASVSVVKQIFLLHDCLHSYLNISLPQSSGK